MRSIISGLVLAVIAHFVLGFVGSMARAPREGLEISRGGILDGCAASPRDHFGRLTGGVSWKVPDEQIAAVAVSVRGCALHWQHPYQSIV
jgi:hypothetical protein